MSSHDQFPTTMPRPDNPPEGERSVSSPYDVQTSEGVPTTYRPPERPTAFEPGEEELINDAQPNKKTRRRLLAGAVLSAVAAATIGGGIALGTHHNSDPTKAGKRPTATAPAVPGASAGASHEASPSAASELSIEQQRQALEIDPSTPTDKLPEVAINRISTCIMMGATPENAKKYMSSNVGSTEFVNKLVEENAAIYGPVLFNGSYERGIYETLAPDDQDLLKSIKEMNREALTAYFATSSKDYGDQEPFHASLVYNRSTYQDPNAILNTPSPVDMTPRGLVKATLVTNADKNRGERWFTKKPGEYDFALWMHYVDKTGQDTAQSDATSAALYMGEMAPSVEQ